MNPNNYFKNLGRITVPFMGKTRNEAKHPGIDFANKSGTLVPAFEDGVVTKVGAGNDGFGNRVVLKDKTGAVHQYGHLQSSMVKPGQVVRKGKPIARMGASGNVYTPSGKGDASHLDLRIASKFGQWKNPLTYLNKFK